MNIKKIKIMATEYEVEEVEQIDKYERLLGQIDYTEQKIKIDKSISEDLKKETMIHEILHGILEKLGYTELNDDEQKVHSIASTLYLVLKENKLISFKYDNYIGQQKELPTSIGSSVTGETIHGSLTCHE